LWEGGGPPLEERKFCDKGRGFVQGKILMLRQKGGKRRAAIEEEKRITPPLGGIAYCVREGEPLLFTEGKIITPS